MLLSAGFVSTSWAEVVQISVSALEQTYPLVTPSGQVPCRETEALDYPGEEVGVVVSISVRLRGTVLPGVGDCDGEVVSLGAELEPWFVNDSAADGYKRPMVVDAGAFEIDLLLPYIGHPLLQDPFNPNDDLLLRLCVRTESGCQYIQHVSVELDEVTFTVTTMSAVPTEKTTWGGIKSLYEETRSLGRPSNWPLLLTGRE
jgi:hypothetical protein